MIAQDDKDFQVLREKVETTFGKEKLKWLDSLATQSYFGRTKNYDSLALETIKLSVTLDTVDVGAYPVVNYANRVYKSTDSKEALQILEDFKVKHLKK